MLFALRTVPEIKEIIVILPRRRMPNSGDLKSDNPKFGLFEDRILNGPYVVGF